MASSLNMKLNKVNVIKLNVLNVQETDIYKIKIRKRKKILNYYLVYYACRIFADWETHLFETNIKIFSDFLS